MGLTGKVLAAVALVATGVAVYVWPGATPQAEAQAAIGAPLADVVLPGELTEAETIGKRGFDAICAACHGDNAAGRNGIGPPLVHRIYEPGHHGDVAFILAVRNGARGHHWPFGDMPPQPGLSEADIRNIIAYVRALQRANGI